MTSYFPPKFESCTFVGMGKFRRSRKSFFLTKNVDNQEIIKRRIENYTVRKRDSLLLLVGTCDGLEELTQVKMFLSILRLVQTCFIKGSRMVAAFFTSVKRIELEKIVSTAF